LAFSAKLTADNVGFWPNAIDIAAQANVCFRGEAAVTWTFVDVAV
jgi:hypothetical protein